MRLGPFLCFKLHSQRLGGTRRDPADGGGTGHTALLKPFRGKNSGRREGVNNFGRREEKPENKGRTKNRCGPSRVHVRIALRRREERPHQSTSTRLDLIWHTTVSPSFSFFRSVSRTTTAVSSLYLFQNSLRFCLLFFLHPSTHPSPPSLLLILSPIPASTHVQK